MPRRSGTMTVWSRDQLRGERRPHVAGLAVAVQQDDGRTLAADAHVKRRAVGAIISVLNAGGNGSIRASPGVLRHSVSRTAAYLRIGSSPNDRTRLFCSTN